MINTTADFETLYGTDGDDELNSGNNGSSLYGEDGDDTLTTGFIGSGYTGELYAFQFGGAGRDSLSVLIRASTYYSFTQLEGGDDDDLLQVRNDIVNMDANADVALNENFLLGGNGDDQLFVDATLMSVNGGNITNETYGGDGNDFINMTARVLGDTDVFLASNYAEGGSGNDTIFVTGSGDADDYVYNVAFGGAGADVLVGRTVGDAYGESYLNGGTGDDVLRTIDGFYNEMYGEAGRDVLFGGTGTDIMEGGTGADTFMFDLNGGNDTITDFTVGTDIFNLINGQTIGSITASGSDTLVTFGDGATVLLQGVTVTDQAQLFA
ncbi:calcium-binding protein [Croceibacterium sp. TMG7-5b_MA50]|uniref:calcium-binding protein n=1 Tax=Croceibacterium sp. TMG7-5b_MA50 TaxID=3121290 RepID=UPI00322170FD